MAPYPASDLSSGNADNLVRLVDVNRRFGSTVALDGISLVARRGEVLGIIGRSGAGKSTLIRCLNGLEKPDSGEIWVDGREISGLSETNLLPLRRRIGMIFQHFNLLSAKTVEENVDLPLKIAGRPLSERRKRVTELLDLVGLSAKAKVYPGVLSGGQKQRVGIARALAAEPALLLSDEATSALDPETTRSILDLLKTINSDLGVTIVLITHEMEVIRGVADRVIVLDKGRIVEQGPVWAVFADPKDATTTSLLTGIRPQLPAAIAARLSVVPTRETILSVDVVGPAAQELIFSDLALAFPGSYRVLHGGIDHVQGQPIGRFFLGVVNEAATSPNDLADYLRARSARVEVLGYV